MEEDVEFLRSHIEIDVDSQLLHVGTRMHWLTLYSYIQDTFDEPGFMQFSVPMAALDRWSFQLINGWDFADLESKKNIKGGGWTLHDQSCRWNQPKEKWAGVRFLGKVPPGTKFKYRIDKGRWKEFKFDGLLDEPVLFPEGAKKIEIKHGKKICTSSLYELDKLDATQIRFPVFIK